MTAQNRRIPVSQCPVRVSPVQVGILVDGLRLKPEAKLHAHLLDSLGQAGHAVRQFFHIDVVIAQTGGVIVSCTEPAVIQHEQLAA